MDPASNGPLKIFHDRRGKVAAVIAVILLCGYIVVVAAHHLDAWTNRARTSRGGIALIVRPELVAVAVRHSQHMAVANRLFHRTRPPAGCPYWGENVGVGTRPYDIFKAFMASPEHRANILNANFHHLGIGAVRDAKGRLWVTEEFCA